MTTAMAVPVKTLPIVLTVPNRVVYIAHDYPWIHPFITTYPVYEAFVTSLWGFVSLDDGAVPPLLFLRLRWVIFTHAGFVKCRGKLSGTAVHQRVRHRP